MIEETLPKGRRSWSSFLMCARGVCATWRPFKVKRRKRTAEQHELNTGNALYNTLPAHMCRPDSARVCVGGMCGMSVCVCYVCVLCVCGVCAAWRQMLKTKPQQAQRSRRLIKMCSQLQRALRRAVGVPRGVVCGIKVPQCAQARK